MNERIRTEPGTAASMVIVVINRWDDDFALYRDYIDHAQHKVIYLVTAAGKKAIPDDLAAAVYELPSSYTSEDLLGCCRNIEDSFARIDRIIAMSEHDLPKAAYLRDTLGVPGSDMRQVVLFTDKVAMKREISRAGLRAPNYIECTSISAVKDFSQANAFPLILKPKVGAASYGVYAVLSRTALMQLLNTIDIRDYECEEYIPGTILHVDGIVCKGRIELIVGSRYINNCLAFNSGVPLGSVFIDDAVLNGRIQTFSKQILETLGLHDGAFHIELIHSESDELVFLELNARVGGAEITFLMRDLFGIDLVGAWVAMQISGKSQLPKTFDHSGVMGGWLLIPEPQEIPCEVVDCASLIGKVPHLYREILPKPGHRFHGDGGYENIAGRFRFNAPTAAKVEEAIYEVLATFKIKIQGIPH